ncbi:hypothetical protein CH063_10682 [Colletotrichum higginsianum]|uniref:Uncharacterized protein n=1 Tax=Colletotrichum higginsianum (strain IMI 349063) TaxID=759273 RepID=H1VIE8_COLHI|nr:hypothetical protein CH063_10682 [Colletotrichum higginsianum]
MFSLPSAEPDGLWFLVIHHMGELEKSSKRLAPRLLAFCSMARCAVSTSHRHEDEAGSALAQSTQWPSICRDSIILGETTMRSPLTAFQLQAPALWRTMLKPSPGRLAPPSEVVLVVKKMSARSSRVPKRRAHQAREVPQPSHVPWSDLASMMVVVSAATTDNEAKPRATAARGLKCMMKE